MVIGPNSAVRTANCGKNRLPPGLVVYTRPLGAVIVIVPLRVLLIGPAARTAVESLDQVVNSAI